MSREKIQILFTPRSGGTRIMEIDPDELEEQIRKTSGQCGLTNDEVILTNPNPNEYWQKIIGEPISLGPVRKRNS